MERVRIEGPLVETISVVEEGGLREEVFRFREELVERLVFAGDGARFELESFPVAPGVRAGVRLERVRLWAGDGSVQVVVDGTTHRLPPTGRVFFRGEVIGDPAETVELSVDPGSGRVGGIIRRSDSDYRLWERSVRLPSFQALSAVPAPAREHETSCQNLGHPELGRAGREPLDDSEEQFLRRLGMTAPAPAVLAGSTGLRQAVIAIDTDVELLDVKFDNDPVAAQEWLEDLFNAMNVFYERDLDLRLLIGETILRVGGPASDPYPDRLCPIDPDTGQPYPACGIPSQVLYDVRGHWSTNHGDIDRVFVAFFSGKQGSPYSGSGIAFVDGYCQETGGGYSATQVLTGNALGTNAQLIGHEIGHNAGSSHTHCYSPPVDTCYAGEAYRGCWDGVLSCPAGGRGTIMSYCHISGCGTSNLSEFHPTVAAHIVGRMDAAGSTCVPPLQATDLLFADGFESGGTSSWN